MSRFIDWLVDWWLRRCPHNETHVAADILEGDWPGNRVCYCRRCGAVRLSHKGIGYGVWRRPQPLWFRT